MGETLKGSHMTQAEQQRFSALRSLPYGTSDLDAAVQLVGTSPRRVRCFVRGCEQVLQPPRRGFRGDVCPDHGIRCHYSSSGATYAFSDVRRNVIASADTFARRIVRHPFKYESHRLGLERSEDSVSWNVFRSLQEAGQLRRVAELITGDGVDVEPFLYLWGICLTEDDFAPWPLLVAARSRFESRLPVDRPFTEPDIALHLPGRYLILIEAKFTSPNTCYERGKRKDSSSLTFDELVGIYRDPRLKLLNVEKAESRDRLFHQLWRNTTFAEWMATEDHPRTKAFHVNLVREGADEQSAGEFHELLAQGYEDRFRRMTWEQVHHLYRDQPGLDRLRRYLETKTAGLRPAFALPRPTVC